MVGPLSYVGGKRALAKRVIEMFPSHTTYVEAFAGGAQVFFHKAPSKVEVLNDLDGEIVNFFRVCQLHYEELLRYSRFVLVSRKWFDLLRATDPGMLTDIQRAARYLYLLKCSFASLVRHPNYHWHVVQPPGFNLERLPQLIENAHKRLERVQICHTKTFLSDLIAPQRSSTSIRRISGASCTVTTLKTMIFGSSPTV
jgi:DNA adenine methylase